MPKLTLSLCFHRNKNKPLVAVLLIGAMPDFCYLVFTCFVHVNRHPLPHKWEELPNRPYKY